MLKHYFLILVTLGMLAICSCSALPKETISLEEININPSEDKSFWIPSPGMSYQIQFTDELDLSIDAEIFELDAFDTDKSVVNQLHQNGKYVICYLNAGAVEDWRPDYGTFPSSLIGNDYEGWPGEKWLDIRQLDLLLPIFEDRLDLCHSKGFDGVEFDNVDGFENNTGFDLTKENQLSFNRSLADAAHHYGLAVGLKNDPKQIADLEPWFDFLILESCFDQGWCKEAAPFLKANKMVVDIEYKDISKFCSSAKELSIALLQKHLELDAWYIKCSIDNIN